MFSKKQRISKKQFDDIFATGKNIKTKYFILKYKNNPENITKVSVVASKKLFKTAVSRNKIKRRFKSVLKQTNIIESNKDLIFILNKSTETTNRNDIALLINQIQLK